jgi:hypothetical protein
MDETGSGPGMSAGEGGGGRGLPERRLAEGWLARARAAGAVGPGGLRPAGDLLFPDSLKQAGGITYALLRLPEDGRLAAAPAASGKALGLFAPTEAALRAGGFEGQRLGLGGGARLLIGPLDHANAVALRRALPFTAPSPLAGLELTFGLGDRLGLAGPGQLRALRRFRASPVLAQQSVRELELTGRSYGEVLDAATWAVFQEGFEEPWGADGDHLKTEDWVRRALGIGFTMITADVSDHIRAGQAASTEPEAEQAYAGLPGDYRRRIEESYLRWSLRLDTGTVIRFSPSALRRAALVYREAVEQAARLYRAGVEVRGEAGFDFELSVDETSGPTTPEDHAFVALEARAAGVRLSSLAPRFVGEFQKGIDYIGDLAELERTFAAHAALARALGHRLSVHSGSDKFSAFPLVGRLTRGRFHLKTAGTSWLEAVRVIARREPALYRRLHAAALQRFEAARRYYHVSTDLDKVPLLSGLQDAELPGLFDNPDARQLLHITYGELLRDPELGRDFFAALGIHLEAYWTDLEAHLGRHLESLGAPLRLRQGGDS